jgi:O-Antigen ligase
MLQTLGYLFNAVPFVVAMGLGLLVPVLLLWLMRSSAAGAAFIALVFTSDAVFFGSARLNLGLHVYVDDLAFLLLGGAVLARWLFVREVPRIPRAWYLLIAVFALAVGAGLVSHGTAAGVQAREHFYAIVAASYFMSFPVQAADLAKFVRAMLVSAMVLLLLCTYRWVVYYLPIPELLPPGRVWSPDGPTRVIASHQTLLMAQLLVIGLFFTRLGAAARGARWMLPLLLAAVLALQHRSVWIAALVGVASALALAPRVQGSRVAQLVALLVVGTLTALPLVFSERLSGVTQEISRSAATAVAGQGTVHSRLQDWRQTLGDWSRAGPRALSVGYGFGRDSARVVVNEQGERRLITFGAHNHYVSVVTTMGVLGLAAFLWVAAGTALGLFRRYSSASADGVVPAALLVLLVMQLAYYVPYAGDYLQHALMGLAVAWVATHKARATPGAAAAGVQRHKEPAWVGR